MADFGSYYFSHLDSVAFEIDLRRMQLGKDWKQNESTDQAAYDFRGGVILSSGAVVVWAAITSSISGLVTAPAGAPIANNGSSRFNGR